MYSVDVRKSSYKSGQSRINDGSHFISWSPWVRCLRLQSRVVHDLIQSKRKQVGQYHELAEIAQEALDMMQLDYEFVYPKKRIYLK